MADIYEDDALVGRLTADLVASGRSIFEIFKLGAIDEEHVAALLRFFHPPHKAHILDAGCGVGEVARLMRAQRPDLSFTLLNRSASQLAMCPNMTKLHGMLEEIPAEDSSFDAAIACYVMGHIPLSKAFSEMARVLKHGGVLLVYDMTAFPRLDCLLAELQYQLHHPSEVIGAAQRSGFTRAYMDLPKGDATDFKAIIGDVDFDRLFTANNVRPVLYRFVKCS